MGRSLGQLTIDVVANVGGFVAGMDKTERASDKWRRSVEKAAYQVGFAIGTAATAAVTALAGITVATIRQADQLTRLAQVAGSNTTEFQRFAAGARSLGIEQDKLGDIFKDVNDKVGDFLLTGGGELADFFKNIAPTVGVTAEQFRMLSGPQALQLYVTSLEKAGLTQNQMTTSMEAIANDATMLLPLLRDGGRLMGEWGDRAQDFGAILDQDAITSLRSMRTDTATATLALEGMKNTLVSELAPALSDFTSQLKSEESRKALQDTAKGIGAIAAQAAYASSEILGLAGTYTSWLRGQGFLPVNERSDVGDLQARQKALQQSLSRWTGVFGDDAKAKVQKEVEQIGKWIQEAQARGPKVTLLENGAMMPESALKPRAGKPYSPSDTTTAKVDGLAQAYAAASLEFERSIALFDQSADGTAKATELQRLNFDLLKGSLKGLAPDLAENLRSQASWLDTLNAQRGAAQQAAKAVEDLTQLRKELNRQDSLGLDLAKERIQTIQEAMGAGAKLGDEEYMKMAGQVIGQVGESGGGFGYQGPDALYGGARGEFDKIDKEEEAENARYAAKLEALEEYRQARADLNAQWDAQEAALNAEHQANLDSLDKSRWQVGLTAAQQGLGGVTDVMRTAFGEQSGLYRAAFVMQKAAAIAQATLAIQAGIAEAAKQPFPANLVAMGSVAVATAGLISNIAAVGMAHDGIDSVPETGTWLLQKGERVTTAATSAKLDATLERVGRDVDGGGSRQLQQNITINGDPSDRDIERYKAAVREGAQLAYSRVQSDIASGNGIGQTLRRHNNVSRRIR